MTLFEAIWYDPQESSWFEKKGAARMHISHESQDAPDSLAPTTDYFKLGLDLLSEVQKTIGDSRLKALRFSIGNRFVRDIRISRATMVVSILIVIFAILITNLKVEIVKEPYQSPDDAAVASGEPS